MTIAKATLIHQTHTVFSKHGPGSLLELDLKLKAFIYYFDLSSLIFYLIFHPNSPIHMVLNSNVILKISAVQIFTAYWSWFDLSASEVQPFDGDSSWSV